MLENGTSVGEPPLVDEVANETPPAEEAGGPPPRSRRPCLSLPGARRTRPPDKLILGSYVKSLEWSRSLADAPASD